MNAPTKNESLPELLTRALPFLRDEAAKYTDDGNNEPLELARTIEAELAGRRNRDAREPGGMQCEKCGSVFIGAEWHVLCGMCIDHGVAQPDGSGLRDGDNMPASMPETSPLPQVTNPAYTALTREAPTEGVGEPVRCPWDHGSPCLEPRPVGMVYRGVPAPRAFGYLDKTGVEWAAFDTGQMEAYARVSYSDGWEAGYAAASALDPKILSQWEDVQRDMRAYGFSIARNGERVDPSEVIATPPAPQRQPDSDPLCVLGLETCRFPKCECKDDPQRLAQGDAASRIRGLIAEIDPKAKPATGTMKLVADELRAISALTTQPPHHDRGEDGLPDLPKPTFITDDDDLFTKRQMREYAIAALTEAKQQGPGEAWAADERPGDNHNWGDFSRTELIELVEALSSDAKVKAVRKWPFVETPGALANRVDMATRQFPLVGALRNVFIENPPTFLVPDAPQVEAKRQTGEG